jgi:hypothetical protein
MKRPSHSPSPEGEAWESDPVWNLLDEAPPMLASPRFADNVMRAIRLDEAPAPWWKRWTIPAAIGTLAAATAAVALTFQAVQPVDIPSSGSIAAAFHEDSFAEVQDLTDLEVLVAAADHLDQYSDTELVSLISL